MSNKYRDYLMYDSKKSLYTFDTDEILQKTNYRKKKLANALPRVVGVMMSIALFSNLSSSELNAAAVRDDIPYQTYKDFGSNTGIFKPGAENLEIYNKKGELIGVLDKAPMADFAAANIKTRVGTLIAPGYIAGVRHDTGYVDARFGSASDALYKIVDRNNHSKIDYHAPRLDKIVTEVEPLEITDVTKGGASVDKSKALLDQNRYAVMYRSGAGTPLLIDANDKTRPTDIDGNTATQAGAYHYITGGVIRFPDDIRQDGYNLVAGTRDLLSDDANQNYPLANNVRQGDSGSPLLAYDTIEKKWVVVGFAATIAGGEIQTNHTWTIPDYDFTYSEIAKDTAPEINLNSQEKAIWKTTDIHGGASISQDANVFIAQGKSSNTNNNIALNDGKNLILKSTDDGVMNIELSNNIHQGAGSLTFNGDAIIQSNNDSSWQGAGIIIEKDKTVQWKIDGVAGDALHRIGEGTLLVNGVGINAGDLNVGDGLTILAQKADENGNVQAFNSIRIVSGRAKVVLEDAKQVNADNIVWGFRGGELDVNGNDLIFNRIRATDHGAVLNNSSAETSTITFNSNKEDYIYHGQLTGNLDIVNTGSTVFPKQNFIIDGSLDLGGNQFTQTNGSLVFQGHAVIHAQGSERKSTFLTQDDWENREFNVKKLNLTNSDFTLGRNATLHGDINAKQSTVHIGSDVAFVDTNNGDIPVSLAYVNESKSDQSITKEIQKIETGQSINGERESKYYGLMNLDESHAVVQDLWVGGVIAENSQIDLVKGVQHWNTQSVLQDSNVLVKDAELTVSDGLTGNGDFDIDAATVHFSSDSPATENYQFQNIKIKNDSVLTFKQGTETRGDIFAEGINQINLGEKGGNLQHHLGSINAVSSVVNLNNNQWSINNPSVIGTLNVSDSKLQFDQSINGSNQFSTLNIDYLNASNTYFSLNTDAEISDKIIINNKAEGENNQLEIGLLKNKDVDVTKGFDILLVSAPSNTADNLFKAQPILHGFSSLQPQLKTEIIDNQKEWRLTQVKTTANKDVVSVANNFMNADYNYFIQDLGSLDQRVGDLRSVHGANYGAWGRVKSIEGQSDEIEKDKYQHMQLGFDQVIDTQKGQLFTGVTGLMTMGETSGKQYSIDSKSYGIGLYGSYISDLGAYIDVLGKYVHHRNDYKLNIENMGETKGSHNSIQLETEVGYRFKPTPTLYVEPQVKLVYGHVSEKSFEWVDEQGSTMKMETPSYNMLVGRAGVHIGKIIDTTSNKWQIHMGVDYEKDLATNRQNILTDRINSYYYDHEKDDRVLVSFGSSVNIKDRVSAGLDVERSFGGRYNIKNAINFNLKYSF